MNDNKRAVIESFIRQNQEFLHNELRELDLVIVNLGKHDAQPAAMIASLTRPKHLFVLYTAESEPRLADFENMVDLGIDRVTKIRVKPSDALNMYSAVRREIEKLIATPARIHVDITGGTSVMSVAIAMIAGTLRGTMSYIEHELDESRKPIPFTGKLIILEDPTLIFGEYQMSQIQESFRNYNYRVATNLLLDNLKKLKPFQHRYPDVYSRFLLRRELAGLYESWERFDTRSALKTCSDLLIQKETALENWPYARLCKHRQALLLLSELGPESNVGSDVLSHARLISVLLAFMLNSAKRRLVTGSYSTGILFAYRALEMSFQFRLAANGIDTSDPDYDRLDDRFPEWRSRCRALFEQLDKRPEIAPEKIALLQGFAILRSINDDFALSIDASRLDKTITIRNQMLLEHGFGIIDHKGLEKLIEFTSAVLKSLFEREGWDWTDVIESTTFNETLP